MNILDSYEYNVRELPLQERPRERLVQLGPEAVSTIELLAILFGSGSRGKSVIQLSKELLTKFGSLKGLMDATIEELCLIKGIGKAKAIQLKAALTLALRISKDAIPPKYKIDHPLRAYNLIKDGLENETRELFLVILLDIRCCLINYQTISIGTLSQSLVHPREVFYPAIRHKAASIIIAHNHPSGDPTPSQEDISITQSLIEVGKVMSIPVKDHLIIGKGTYLSLRETGKVKLWNKG